MHYRESGEKHGPLSCKINRRLQALSGYEELHISTYFYLRHVFFENLPNVLLYNF